MGNGKGARPLGNRAAFGQLHLEWAVGDLSNSVTIPRQGNVPSVRPTPCMVLDLHVCHRRTVASHTNGTSHLVVPLSGRSLLHQRDSLDQPDRARMQIDAVSLSPAGLLHDGGWLYLPGM